MSSEPASHFEIRGKDVRAVVDTAGVVGKPVVSLDVNGRATADPSFATTPLGHVVTAVIEAVPDSHTSEISVFFPEVNLEGKPATFSCFATVTTTRTSIIGPGGLTGACRRTSSARWPAPPRELAAEPMTPAISGGLTPG